MFRYFNIIYYEIILRLKEMKRYRVQVLSEVTMFILIYLASIVSDWGSAFTYELGVSKADSVRLVFIGYAIWQIGCIALGYSSNFIKREATEGVLEVKQQSIFSYEILLFVRMGISVAASITIFVTVTLALMMLWGWSLHECFSCLKALMIGLPVVTGMFGMGLIFGAAVLNEKDIGKSVIIVQAVLLFFSNVFSTVKFKWIFLFPYTWGIDLGRNIFLEKPLILTDVLCYAAINLIWLMIGHALFARALRKERLHGMFDNY